jgi:chemotaxis protein MotB
VEDETNPYIALADLAINLVLILAFFAAAVNALGRAGWEQVRYRDAQREFREAIRRSLSGAQRPLELGGKNDPPGVQRWVFPGSVLFQPGGPILRREGKAALIQFAQVLSLHRNKWRRIRIEGHTRPPAPGEPDDWDLSCRRAAAVEQVFYFEGHLAPNLLAVAGRAGQDPVRKGSNDPVNERVEILIEYAAHAAQSPGLSVPGAHTEVRRRTTLP